MSYTAREDVPWTDDEIRLLHKVWLAIHVNRFDAAKFGGPDNFYNGTRVAERAVTDIAGVHLGYSYGWLADLIYGENNEREEVQTEIQAD